MGRSISLRGAILFASGLYVFLCVPVARALDAPPPGKALVYLIQGNTGGFYNLVVRVDNSSVGRVKANSYLSIVTGPGTHRISVAASGVASISLNTVAGHVYYIGGKVNANGIPEFQFMSAGEARSWLMKHGAITNDSAHASPGAPAKSTAPGASPQKSAASATAKPATQSVKSSKTNNRSSPHGGVVAYIKSGSFALSSGTQNWFGVDSTVTTGSSGYFGAGIEYLFENDFSIGGEYFRFKNKWVQTDGNSGSFSSTVYLGVGKKYFRVNDTFYPYVGIGLGGVTTSFSGGITGGTSDLASQLMAGAEFRFQRVGVFIELSSLSAKTTAANGDKIDASGKATSVGLRVHF